MVDTRFPVSVHIMVSLAYHRDELLDSAQLARVLKTNPTFVRKLLSRLVEAGLVTSVRGKGGGFRLTRDAASVTLRDVYLAATEGRALVRTPQKPAFKPCPVSCSMSDILDHLVEGIEDATCTYLARIRLSDLLAKVAMSAEARAG